MGRNQYKLSDGTDEMMRRVLPRRVIRQICDQIAGDAQEEKFYLKDIRAGAIVGDPAWRANRNINRIINGAIGRGLGVRREWLETTEDAEIEDAVSIPFLIFSAAAQNNWK